MSQKTMTKNVIGVRCYAWLHYAMTSGTCHFLMRQKKELLPPEWNHERLTVEIVRCDEMRKIWDAMTPLLKADDIVKLAVGEKELSKFEQVVYSPWESILAEIITGDSFGVTGLIIFFAIPIMRGLLTENSVITAL